MCVRPAGKWRRTLKSGSSLQSTSRKAMANKLSPAAASSVAGGALSSSSLTRAATSLARSYLLSSSKPSGAETPTDGSEDADEDNMEGVPPRGCFCEAAADHGTSPLEATTGASALPFSQEDRKEDFGHTPPHHLASPPRTDSLPATNEQAAPTGSSAAAVVQYCCCSCGLTCADRQVLSVHPACSRCQHRVFRKKAQVREVCYGTD